MGGAELVVGVAGEGPAAFVDGVVMGVAQEHEVAHGGRGRPVHDVMGVKEPGVGALSEPAAPVAVHERPPQLGADRALGGTDPDQHPVTVLHRQLGAAVAQQPVAVARG